MNRALQPFRGLVSPGCHFSDGHTIIFFRFDESPAHSEPISGVWVITPEAKRFIYVHPQKAEGIVKTYHDFPTLPAMILWRFDGRNALGFTVSMGNEDVLSMSVSLGRTLRSATVNLFAKLVPAPWADMKPVIVAEEIAANALLGLGGVKMAGNTETGRRYVNHARRIALVADAEGTFGGKPLGKLIPPSQPIARADSIVPLKPIVSFGTMYFEYP